MKTRVGTKKKIKTSKCVHDHPHNEENKGSCMRITIIMVILLASHTMKKQEKLRF